MGPAVRPPSHHHQRQGTPVRLLTVVLSLLPPQHLPRADHRLSSPGKRRCGMFPPETEGCPASTRSRGRQAFPTAMGHARYPVSLEGEYNFLEHSRSYQANSYPHRSHRTCSLCFERNFQTIERVRFASIFKFFDINMFASLRNKFSNYRTCLLRFDF
jgi:hypothetical protein